LQDFGLSKFQWLLGVAKAVRLPMRISETNSLCVGVGPLLRWVMQGRGI
jgi:hypothetical protein